MSDFLSKQENQHSPIPTPSLPHSPPHTPPHSPPHSPNLTPSLTHFSLDVVDHLIEGDFSSLDAHIFILEIWLQQQPYRLRRSYKDICEFDNRLKKKYPKTILPPFPFSASPTSLHSVAGEKKGGSIRESLVNLKNNARDSIAIVGRRGTLHDINVVNPDELVSKKKPQLLEYLKLLLNIPEIVRSTNMLDFLDKASINGEEYEEESIVLMDMLLEGIPEKSVNIVKKHSVKFEVVTGEYIVWRFSTKKRDLGFSIDINDTNVLTYQRYNCHEKHIENVLRVPMSGTATLLWDNSYSKLRTKHLFFRCKVLSNELYKEHSKNCVDSSREQLANQSRRGALQRELVQKSHQLLATQGGRLISQDFTVDMTSGDKVVHEDLQTEISQLRNEKSSLQMALSESEIALADIRQELVTMKKELDKNKTVTEELNRVIGERDELQQEILDESMAKKKLEIDLHSLKIDMASSKDELEAQRHQNQADAHALATLQHQQSLLHDEISRLLDEINNLKSTERSTIPDAAAQIQRLKGEKKQLKAYAISLKNQMEEYEKDSKVKVQHSESDLKVANSLVKKMTPLLRSLERELAGLQGLKNEYVAKKGLSSGNTSDNLVKMTTAAIESGMNTSDNVGMMLDYADMKLSAMETNTGNKKTVDQNSSDLNETRQENHKPVVVHTGSVFGDVVTSPPSAHHSTSTLSSSPSPTNTLGPTDHPSTCTCVKCKAPAKRTSMMETVINSLLDPEPNDSAK